MYVYICKHGLGCDIKALPATCELVLKSPTSCHNHGFSLRSLPTAMNWLVVHTPHGSLADEFGYSRSSFICAVVI